MNEGGQWSLMSPLMKRMVQQGHVVVPRLKSISREILLTIRPVFQIPWKRMSVPLEPASLRSIERWTTNPRGKRTERKRTFEICQPASQGTLRRMLPPKEHLAANPK